ncbi:hypothetical protein B0E48_16680 [Rhodanobacter sp. C03]|nr:hypothetical protein B0E48_16680 [Rhodanobacter sp. C03]
MGITLIILLSIVGLGIYFIPSFVAYGREHPNETAIIVLNLFLGWTVIGWVGSLVWAFTTSSTRVPLPEVRVADEGTTKNCPFCAEPVRQEAIKCKHCGSALAESISTAQSSAAPTSSATTDERAMQLYDITLQGDKYVFRGYRYDKLSDAVSYAKKQGSSDGP